MKEYIFIFFIMSIISTQLAEEVQQYVLKDNFKSIKLSADMSDVADGHYLQLRLCRQSKAPQQAVIVWCIPAAAENTQLNIESINRCSVSECMIMFNITRDKFNNYYTIISSGDRVHDYYTRDHCFDITIREYGYDIGSRAFKSCSLNSTGQFDVDMKSVEGSLTALENMKAKMSKPGYFADGLSSSDKYVAAITGGIFGLVLVVMGIFYFQMNEDEKYVKPVTKIAKFNRKRK